MTTKADRRAPGASTGQRTGRAEIVPLHGGRLMTPWQKGQSGNPSGMANISAYHEARRVCAEASPKAAQVQIALLDDGDPRIRLLAAEAVLSRGVGKPRDHGAEERDNAKINLSHLSDDELRSLGVLLKKAIGIPAG